MRSSIGRDGCLSEYGSLASLSALVTREGKEKERERRAKKSLARYNTESSLFLL